ncbi:MAG: pectate lyase [Myxococcales bacterium]|nr:pectate lyase [Myxococcales bacterium]
MPVPASIPDAGAAMTDDASATSLVPEPQAPTLGPAPCEPVPAGEQLAFPGAEGFGRFARGGRGGDVCHVTHLGDGGPGSLRACVGEGGRTVVFDVGGWITLEDNLGITVDRLTIAGQTAPGGGIGVRGRKLSIGGSDIVMRFVRVRRGILVTTERNDAMAISSAAERVIIDHCSVGFGTDENLSMPGDEGEGPQDLTLQWSIVAWGLQRNNHSAGSLLTASRTTIHHSLYAFNSTRNPKARSEDGRPLDFVNNVIYGWNAPDPKGEAQGWDISKQAFLLGDTANGTHVANAVGNYFIAHGSVAASHAFSSGRTAPDGTPTFKLYFEDNLLDGNANGMLDVSKDDWSMVGTATRLDARAAAPTVCTQPAADALSSVMEQVGATLPSRDETDAALIAAIRAQEGFKIHDEGELQVGDSGYGELSRGQARPDSDQDGMPDGWETEHNLDPQDPDDRNGDPDGDGYTHLEAYLNALAAPAFEAGP